MYISITLYNSLPYSPSVSLSPLLSLRFAACSLFFYDLLTAYSLYLCLSRCSLSLCLAFIVFMSCLSLSPSPSTLSLLLVSLALPPLYHSLTLLLVSPFFLSSFNHFLFGWCWWWKACKDWIFSFLFPFPFWCGFGLSIPWRHFVRDFKVSYYNSSGLYPFIVFLKI